MAALFDRPFNVAAEIERLRNLAHEVCLGPSTRAIVEAVSTRGIPYRRLNNDSLVLFGHGRKQRRIQAAETDRTSAIAEAIAQDKEMTRMMLRAVGVPTPCGRPVADAEDAWRAAGEIGVPVVVKPQDGNQGRGVATNLTTREQVIHAFEAARQEGEHVIVEKFAPGHDYRLLVVGERVVAAARREPAQVMGDGLHTIVELVEEVNADPRRGEHHATVLSKIKLDAVSLAVLADQGYTPSSIPAAGTTVLIRRNANLSTGGTAIDVTERVHPAVAANAVDAAKIVGLDIAGVDIVAQDISRPLSEQGGIIVEVNAAPGLRMHLDPSVGISRPVGEAIADILFPLGETGRIPIVAVTGVNGKTTTTRFIAHVLRGTGKTVGMTCTDGIFVNDRRIDSGDCSGPQSARSILINPSVDMAVFETARGGILREGLAFDHCDVAVVTNIGDGDHLGISDVNTPEDLAKVKRCIVEVGGARRLRRAQRQRSAGGGNGRPLPRRRRILRPRSEIIRWWSATAAWAAGRSSSATARSFSPRGTAKSRSSRWPVCPLTRGGQIAFQVENTLASIAAAWSLGIPNDLIRTRAESIAADIDKVPGRFNVLEIEGATVVVDYGHNAHSLAAVIEAINTFPHARRTCLYTTAGDRRDVDIVRQGELLGGAFDRVVLYEDHYRRGRADGEIMGLLRKGLASATRTKEILEVVGANKAAEVTLTAARPGELVLLQADTIDETVQWLKGYLEALAAKNAEANEAAVGEPVLNGIEPLPPAKQLAPDEIDSEILAEAQTAAKF